MKSLAQLSLFDGKVCKKCGFWKPLISFKTHKECEGGREHSCRQCNVDPQDKKRWDRENYRRHREDRLASAKTYQKDHWEEKKVYLKQWYEANKEHTRDYRQQRKDQDPERYYEYSRQQSRKWRKANPDKILAQCAKQRARRMGVPGTFTADEWRMLLDHYGEACLCCGKVKRLHRDHVIPLVKGGTNDITNLQPLCHSCNSRKNVKDRDYRPDKGEWARRLKQTNTDS